MDNNEIIRLQVVRAFNEYRDYVELVNEENSKKQKLVEDLKQKYQEDKQDLDVKDFSFEIFIVDAYHKQDVEILGTKFVYYMRLYKDLKDVEPLDEEIENTYNLVKNADKEQVFVVDKGKFQEITKGFIEEKKKVFEEKDLFNKVQADLEKILQ